MKFTKKAIENYSKEFAKVFRDVEALSYFTEGILIPYSKSNDKSCFEGTVEVFDTGYVMFIRCGFVRCAYSKYGDEYILSMQNEITGKSITLDSTKRYDATDIHCSILDIID